MTDLARMDCLATRRLPYYMFQICLNVSLHWMHGGTNGLLTRRLLQRESGYFLWKKRYVVISFGTSVSPVSLMRRFFFQKKKIHLVQTKVETTSKYVHADVHIWIDMQVFLGWVLIILQLVKALSVMHLEYYAWNCFICYKPSFGRKKKLSVEHYMDV